MDPISHTLAGGALAGTGLRRLSPGATATLLLAFNAPDVDALAYLFDPHWALAFRRGLTHGPFGLLVLPVLAVGAVGLWQRRRGKAVRVLPLLGLAYLGAVLHLLMDWTNSYGIRFWEPFSSRWSYLDALFIVDPWLWFLLGSGLLVGWRWGERWVRWAVGGAFLYMLLMAGLAHQARSEVRRAWEDLGKGPALDIMVAPAMGNPLKGSVIVETLDAYHLGSFRRFGSERLQFRKEPLPKISIAAGLPLSAEVALKQAQKQKRVRYFLVWSRFPYYRLAPNSSGGADVAVGDARFAGFARAGSLSGLTVQVAAPSAHPVGPGTF